MYKPDSHIAMEQFLSDINLHFKGRHIESSAMDTIHGQLNGMYCKNIPLGMLSDQGSTWSPIYRLIKQSHPDVIVINSLHSEPSENGFYVYVNGADVLLKIVGADKSDVHVFDTTHLDDDSVREILEDIALKEDNSLARSTREKSVFLGNAFYKLAALDIDPLDLWSRRLFEPQLRGPLRRYLPIKLTVDAIPEQADNIDRLLIESKTEPTHSLYWDVNPDTHVTTFSLKSESGSDIIFNIDNDGVVKDCNGVSYQLSPTLLGLIATYSFQVSSRNAMTGDTAGIITLPSINPLSSELSNITPNPLPEVSYKKTRGHNKLVENWLMKNQFMDPGYPTKVKLKAKGPSASAFSGDDLPDFRLLSGDVDIIINQDSIPSLVSRLNNDANIFWCLYRDKAITKIIAQDPVNNALILLALTSTTNGSSDIPKDYVRVNYHVTVVMPESGNDLKPFIQRALSKDAQFADMLRHLFELSDNINRCGMRPDERSHPALMHPAIGMSLIRIIRQLAGVDKDPKDWLVRSKQLNLLTGFAWQMSGTSLLIEPRSTLKKPHGSMLFNVLSRGVFKVLKDGNNELLPFFDNEELDSLMATILSRHTLFGESAGFIPLHEDDLNLMLDQPTKGTLS